MTNHSYTRNQMAWLRNNRSLMVLADVVKTFNQHFHTQLTQNQIKSVCHRHGIKAGGNGQFCSGQIPFNKGTKGLTGTQENCRKNHFKKGHKPPNYRSVGSIRIRSRDNIIDIKIADPNQWVPFHHIIYKRAYGDIPPNHVVTFKDGNHFNLHFSNLTATSRSGLVRVNQFMGNNQIHPELRESVINMVQVDAAIKGRMR